MIKIRFTLSSRIFLSSLVIVLTAITILGILLTSTFKKSYVIEVEDSLRTFALILTGDVRNELESGHAAKIKQKLQAYKNNSAPRITVIDLSGKVLGDSYIDIHKLVNHKARPEFISALKGRTGVRIGKSSTLGVDMIYVAVPVKVGSRVVGAVRAAKELHYIHESIIRAYLTLFLFEGLIFILLLVVGYPLSLRVTQPLRLLDKAALRLAHGDYSVRVKPHGNDEISGLAQSFNYMGNTIEKSMRQLEGEKQRIEIILDNLAEGVLVTDKNGLILTINKASEKMFDIDSGKVCGKPVVEALVNHEINADILNALAHNEKAESEITLAGPVARVFRLYSVPLPDMKGNLSGSLIVFHDVSKLKHLQQIRQDFVANVSHELRTPIASIKAMAETLLSGALSDNTVSYKFLGTINSEADRLSRLVDDLLHLAKIESRKSPMIIEEIELRELAERTCLQLTSKAADFGLEIIRVYGEDTRISADRDKLNQIFVNLIDNAITHSGGSKIWVRIFDKPTSMRIEVEDNGIGVPDAELSRIFERFYRIDKARSRQYGGTGLGLAIVKHIVEAHYGTITVARGEFGGAQFVIWVPKGLGSHFIKETNEV